MTLSIVIVNYNVKHFLQQCLQSIEKAKQNLNLEIIVVDNNSVDNSIIMLKQKFPHVKLIVNKKNKGFSKANNQAIKQAQGKYILLLNPDTLLQEDTLIKTVQFLEKDDQIGALGVKMVDGNGKFLPESKRSLPSPSSAFYKIFGLSKLFPHSKTFGKYHLNYLSQQKIHEVDVLSGAFFMTRKKILNEIGLLDEKFFMYGEDIDLSYRIQQHGYKNVYIPTTSIIHYKGESTKKTSVNYVITFYKAMIIFVKKHYNQKSAAPLIFLIQLAILLRASIAIIKRLVVKRIYPFLDAIFMFIGLYVIKNIWATKYFLNKDYYNDFFIKFGIPTYILFWLFGIYVYRGYEIPVKISNVIRGVFLGTCLLLISYSLLPENLRFSRALILFGALWTIISTVSLRYVCNMFGINFLKIKSEKLKRIAIVSNYIEFERIKTIISNINPIAEFICQIAIKKNDQNHPIGYIHQLKEVVEVHQIDEVIFSAEDMKSNEIITCMEQIQKRIEIKIAPSKSTFIIGSNSIHTQNDFYSLNEIHHKNNPIISFFKKYIDFFN